MSLLKRFVEVSINILGKIRVKVNEVIRGIIEAGRTNSYVETYSDKADTLHRHIKENSERDLKKAFEFNTKNAIRRMGLGRVILAFDVTEELYFGENGGLNVRQIKHQNGAEEAFSYLVLNIIKPKPLPLMVIPYKQGDDIVSLIKELIEYARSLRIIIECVLFDRGFYIGDLISYLSSINMKYLILVPENKAMKKYIQQTNCLRSFNHLIGYNKYKSTWTAKTKIVIIRDKYFNKKVKKWKKFYWCFATNLQSGFNLVRIYKQRWQIETDFRVQDEARIKSKSNIPLVRYFYFLTSLILMANWELNRIKHPDVPFKKYLKNIEQIFQTEIT
jgi:hypothetical protein